MAMKLIDADKENACRLAEANAIRAKLGSSATLTYDWENNKGFADAIAAIIAGGIEESSSNTLTTTAKGARDDGEIYVSNNDCFMTQLINVTGKSTIVFDVDSSLDWYTVTFWGADVQYAAGTYTVIRFDGWAYQSGDTISIPSGAVYCTMHKETNTAFTGTYTLA